MWWIIICKSFTFINDKICKNVLFNKFYKLFKLDNKISLSLGNLFAEFPSL